MRRLSQKGITFSQLRKKTNLNFGGCVRTVGPGIFLQEKGKSLFPVGSISIFGRNSGRGGNPSPIVTTSQSKPILTTSPLIWILPPWSSKEEQDFSTRAKVVRPSTVPILPICKKTSITIVQVP